MKTLVNLNVLDKFFSEYRAWNKIWKVTNDQNDTFVKKRYH